MKEVAWNFLKPFKVETYVMFAFFHKNKQECNITNQVFKIKTT